MSDAKTDGGTTGGSTGTTAAAAATSAGAGSPPSAADPKAYNLGLSDTAGHKGAITLNDNAPIESVILAYQVVRKLAEHISIRVQARYGECDVLMHNPADFVALTELRTFFTASEEFGRIFNDLIKAANASSTGEGHKPGLAPALVLPVLGSIINSVLQVFSLFRSDEDIKSYKIEVEDQVLAMTVAGRLVAAKCRVVSSAVVPADPLRTSKVLTKLQDLRKLRMDLAVLLDKLNAAPSGSPVEHESAKAEAPPKDPKKAELIARIGEALKSYDAFELGLAKLDEKTAHSALSRIMAVENLEELLKKEKLCILWVKAVAAGGGSHAKVSTFTNALTYSGGAVVSYAIFDNTGVLKEADTVPMYGGKISVADLKETKLGLAPYGLAVPASKHPPPALSEAEIETAKTTP